MSGQDNFDFCFGRGLMSFRHCKPRDKPPTMLDVMKHYVYLKKQYIMTDCDLRIMVTKNLRESFGEQNPDKTILLSDKTIRDKIKNMLGQETKV